MCCMCMILSDGGRSKELGQVTCGFTLWSLMDKSDHPPLEPWLQPPHGSLPLSPPANPPHPLHGDLSVFIPDTVVSGHEIPLQSLGTWLMHRSLPGVCAPEFETMDWGRRKKEGRKRLLNLYCKMTVSVWVMFQFLLVLAQLICSILPMASSVSPHALLWIAPICCLLPNSPDCDAGHLSVQKYLPGKPPRSLLPSGCLAEYLSPCFSTYCLTNPNGLSCVLQDLAFVIICLPAKLETWIQCPGNSLPSQSAHSKNSYICIWNVL